MSTATTATLISRPRLLRHVRAGLRHGHVLIAAPPGYGKSTLLREIERALPDARLLILSPADADLSVLDARLTPLLSHAALLLDDVHHLVDAPEAWPRIATLLGGKQPRLVLAGRTLPSEAQDRGRLLTADDLAFTTAEAAAVGLHEAALLERMGGWPLALGLLAQHSRESLPQLSSADQDLIAELVDNLLGSLPDALARFLLVSAVPLHFTLELAEHLLGAPAGDLLAEAQRRQLFLEAVSAGDWRYHPLVRRELLLALPDLRALQQRASAWWEGQGDVPEAIEQALEMGLPGHAAELITGIAPRFVARTGRLRTYQRWITALDDATHARFPQLLTRLGLDYANFYQLEEARRWLDRGVRLAQGVNVLTHIRAQLDLADFLVAYEEDATATLALSMPALDVPELPPGMHRQALKTTANALMFRGAYRQSAQFLRVALALPETSDGPTDSILIQNLFIVTLLQGAWGEAEHLVREYERRIGSEPTRRINALNAWGWLHEAQGDWAALQRDLGEIAVLQPQLEQAGYGQGDSIRLRALLLIGQGQVDAAEALLETDRTPDSEESYVYWHIYQAWIARRRGVPARAVALADDILAQPGAVPQARALLALEGDVAAWEAGRDQPLHGETRTLLRLRIRPQLIRLRALLALRCWRAGDARWRRHLGQALRGLQLPLHRLLLTQRDPELGAAFYALALRAGHAEASAALAQIGRIEPLLPLLHNPAVAPAAAATLLVLGDERAIPHLAAAAETATDPRAAHALGLALEQLEQRPPPALTVTLFHTFSVTRNGLPIPSDAWQRPGVQRLLARFALDRTRPLHRDRILDDLWPDSPPSKAAASFRTVYSQLLHVLDPWLRPRARARFFTAHDNVYTFDPYGCVAVDVEGFERIVGTALRTAEIADLPPLDDDLLQALASYGPLLPHLPYAEWLLEPRERLNDLYAAGCQLVAEALLARARPAEALPWSERAIVAAPWLEEAHQSRIRALARSGQRSQALRASAQATEALRTHLNAELSLATAWLAERLRRDEEI